MSDHDILKGSDVDREDIIAAMRDNESDGVDVLERVIEFLDGQEYSVPETDTSGLYTDVPSIRPGDIPGWFDGEYRLNGEYVHPVFARITQLLNVGASPIIAIVGKERYGKSMTALYIENKLHELNVLRGEFNPQSQVVYSVLEFLLFVLDNSRRALHMEEANETLNKNSYNTLFNHAVASAMRTQGKRQIPYIFSAPEFNEFDPRIQAKVDIVIELERKRKAKVTGYRKRHGYRGSGKDYIYNPDYPRWRVPDVPTDLKEEYEAIDSEFKGDHLKGLLKGVLRKRKEQIEEQSTATL